MSTFGTFLGDIFKELGYDCHETLTYLNDQCVISCNIPDKSIKKDFLAFINSETEKDLKFLEDLYDTYGQYITNANSKEDFLNKAQDSSINETKTIACLKYHKANHVILSVFHNDYVYNFDPTNRNIYRVQDDYHLDNNLIYLPQYNHFNFELMKKIKNGNYIPVDEAEKINSRTKKLCEDNYDLFFKFYNDHKDMYEDVSKRLTLFKT